MCHYSLLVRKGRRCKFHSQLSWWRWDLFTLSPKRSRATQDSTFSSTGPWRSRAFLYYNPTALHPSGLGPCHVLSSWCSFYCISGISTGSRWKGLHYYRVNEWMIPNVNFTKESSLHKGSLLFHLQHFPLTVTPAWVPSSVHIINSVMAHFGCFPGPGKLCIRSRRICFLRNVYLSFLLDRQ